MKSDFEAILFLAAVALLAAVSMPGGKDREPEPAKTAAVAQQQ